MCPFEFVATATDSPSDSPAGSFRKFGTAVNGISGTPVIVAFCCAAADPATSVKTAIVQTRYLCMRDLSAAHSVGQTDSDRREKIQLTVKLDWIRAHAAIEFRVPTR